MIRWVFLLLVLANCFPALMAANLKDAKVAPERGERVDAGAKNILLLAEAGEQASQSGVEEAASNALPERRDVSCFLVGPLVSAKVADQVASRFKETGLAVDSGWREVESGADYWVYLPPQPSPRATTRLLQELKANQIDSFLVFEGDLEGAIALSVFNEKENAKNFQGRMFSLGYDAEIHKMQRWIREYWLLSEAVPRGEQWQQIIKPFESDGIQQKMSRRSCKTVASAMRFQ
ncbi:MAG: hypothetical protein M0Q95_20535 [Porticoccaceae bacterium]|nr:hypothetical protein [Porticoccaceae bacterium]